MFTWNGRDEEVSVEGLVDAEEDEYLRSPHTEASAAARADDLDAAGGEPTPS